VRKGLLFVVMALLATPVLAVVLPQGGQRPRGADITLVYEREVFAYRGGERRDPFQPLTQENQLGPQFRELSLRYTFNRSQLEPLFGNFIKRVSLSLIGRNLLTFTDYSGYDPEVSNSGDAAVYRRDNFAYPHIRTLTGAIEIEF